MRHTASGVNRPRPREPRFPHGPSGGQSFLVPVEPALIGREHSRVRDAAHRMQQPRAGRRVECPTTDPHPLTNGLSRRRTEDAAVADAVGCRPPSRRIYRRISGSCAQAFVGLFPLAGGTMKYVRVTRSADIPSIPLDSRRVATAEFKDCLKGAVRHVPVLTFSLDGGLGCALWRERLHEPQRMLMG